MFKNYYFVFLLLLLIIRLLLWHNHVENDSFGWWNTYHILIRWYVWCCSSILRQLFSSYHEQVLCYLSVYTYANTACNPLFIYLFFKWIRLVDFDYSAINDTISWIRECVHIKCIVTLHLACLASRKLNFIFFCWEMIIFLLLRYCNVVDICHLLPSCYGMPVW